MHHPRSLIRRAARSAAPLLLAALLAAVSAGPLRAETAWVASTAIQLVDLDSGALAGQLVVAADQVVEQIAFDPAGDTALVASMGGLFPVDPDTLEVGAPWSPRPTCSVARAAAADRAVALHLLPPGEGLANRERGIPSTVTLQVYEASSGTPLAAAEVHGRPLRAAIAPDGDRIYVLDSNEARLSVYDGAARPLGEVDLAPDGAAPALCTDLALAPDGASLAVMRRGPGGAALLVVHPRDPVASSAVRIEPLGAEPQARGVAQAPDGAIFLSAIGHLARYHADRPGALWRDVGHQFSLVAVTPSGRHVVMATPTFDEARGTGAVLVADPEGNPLRVIELTGLSPYTLAIQP